jgi:hypothetical protein
MSSFAILLILFIRDLRKKKVKQYEVICFSVAYTVLAVIQPCQALLQSSPDLIDSFSYLTQLVGCN